jgi:Fic family protein
LVKEKTKSLNRDEAEIAGYREVLKMVNESHDFIPISKNDILALHKHLYTYSNSNLNGKFKTVDNYIKEIDFNGNMKNRFQPASPMLTDGYMEELCNEYNNVLAKEDIDPLLVIPCFILDFLCIHPFNDGNGRMARLLTLLLMYKLL